MARYDRTRSCLAFRQIGLSELSRAAGWRRRDGHCRDTRLLDDLAYRTGPRRDRRDVARSGSSTVDETRRRTPECGFRIDNTVCHLAFEQREAGRGEFGTNVLGNDGLTRRLGKQAAEDRPPVARTINEHVECIDHAIDIKW